jgi:hypothetical protein
MAMPKASVDEDRDAIAPEHDVWPAGQTGGVKSIAKASAEKRPSYSQLG